MQDRLLAIKNLIEVNKGGYSQIVFGNSVERAENVKFLSALFYGTLERKLTLDKGIYKYAKKLDEVVLAVLECAFYELSFMNTAEHAVVFEYVELTKKLKKSSASGLVNAVLHKFIKDGKVLPNTTLSEIGSCTDSIAKSLEEWFGYEKAKEFLLNSFGRPKLYKRINTLKVKTDNPCQEITTDEVIGEDFKNGLYHIQDIASQKAALALGAKPNDRVLDVCAAPGSKSYVLAEEMNNIGQIISCDLVPSRVKKIEEGAKRLGISIIEAKVCDGTKDNLSLGLFDKILCDVPCSGLGVINKKPEIKQKEMKEFENLPILQHEILKNALKHLKPNGVLVYSTCTINPKENEEVINRLGTSWEILYNEDFFIARYTLSKT